jgi:hypothetical protein
MRKYFITALLALSVAAGSAQSVQEGIYYISSAGDTSLFDEIIYKMEDNIAKNYYGDFDTLDLPVQYYSYVYDSAQTLLFAKYMEVQPSALWLQDAAATDSYRKKLGVPDDDSWKSRRRAMTGWYKWNAFGYLNETFATADVNSTMFKIRLHTDLSSRHILREHVSVLNLRRRGHVGVTFRKSYCSRSPARKPDSTDFNFFTVTDTIYENLPCHLLKNKTTIREATTNAVYIINKNDYALLYYSRIYKSAENGENGFSAREATYAKVGNCYRNVQYTAIGLYNDPLFGMHKLVYGYAKERLWRNASPLDSARSNRNVDIVKQPNALMLEEWNRFIGSKAAEI